MASTMKPVHLLLVAAAIIEAYLDSMIDDPSHDVGASAGRRGGRVSLTTSGSFRISANRAGNDEEEFGEADEDPPIPQADLAKPSESDSLSVGEALDADDTTGGRFGRRRRRRRHRRLARKRKSETCPVGSFRANQNIVTNTNPPFSTCWPINLKQNRRGNY